jgi:hypothetical protein
MEGVFGGAPAVSVGHRRGAWAVTVLATLTSIYALELSAVAAGALLATSGLLAALDRAAAAHLPRGDLHALGRGNAHEPRGELGPARAHRHQHQRALEGSA